MTMWLNPNGSSIKNPYDYKAKLVQDTLKNDEITPSPEYTKSLLNPVSTEQIQQPTIWERLKALSANGNNGYSEFPIQTDTLDTTPQQQTQSISYPQMLPAHTIGQDAQPQLPGFIRSINNSAANSAITGPIIKKLVEATGNAYDPSKLAYEPKGIIENLAGMAGYAASDAIPWMIGGGLVGKGLSAAAKLAPVAKGLSAIPQVLKPALGTGLNVGLTATGPINALETAVRGDGLAGVEERLKQAPLMALGGVALHGGGQLIGKGISKGVGALKRPNPTPGTLPTPEGSLPITEPTPQPFTPLGNPIPQGQVKPIEPQPVANPLDTVNSNNPIRPNNPIESLRIPKDEKIFWTSVNKELVSKGELPPFSIESMKKEIVDGKIDISKLSNEEDVRRLLGMDLQKFAEGTQPITQEPINQTITQQLVASQLPEPQSKIIIGKPKDSLRFKDSLKKFYTRVVNTQQPIVDVAKLDNADTGKLASNSRSVSGIVDYNLIKGLVDKNGNKVGESLQKVVETIPKGEEKDFWTYMSQLHNIDRAREGKPVQANYTPNMSMEAVKKIEQANPEYKAIGKSITSWIDNFMQTWGVDTGIVNKELYQGLRDTYKNYFPTQRDFSTLEKAIPDNVSQKFADQRTPIRRATGSERDIIDPAENIMNLVNRTIRTAKYNEVGQSLLESVRNNPDKLKPFAEVIKTKDGMFSKLDNVITVLENGKPVYLRINDKPLLDAMNGLPKSIGRIPVLDTLTNAFKGLVTQKNPIFALRNILRDIPTAYIYGSEPNPLKFGAGIAGAAKDIITNSPRLQKYQAVGGGGANFFSSGDLPKSAAELTGKVNPLKNLAIKPIKAIEKFNSLTETAPRLAEFNRVFKRTGDVNKALFAANDVTVNFSRGGNITKSVDKGVPYLNAGVQGLDKFFRGFKNPKTALSTIVKAGVAITAPDLALYMVNKDDPNYQALDNRTKDAYFLIPKGDGTFYKIPKSRELGVLFGSLFERSLRKADGQKDSFKGFGNSVKTSFAPANPFDSNFSSPATYNIYINKDFANRPIVPQAMLMDKRSKYLQYDEKTTSIAKAIGELTTNIPGLPGGLSPKQLDYLAKSYSGVIGQFGMPLLVSGGSPSKSLKTSLKADPTFSNQTTTDFYDKLDKLSASAVDKNILEKIPSKKLTPEEDIKNSMSGISTSLSRGTKLINKIQSTNSSLKDMQIKAIRVQMIDLMSRANAANDPKSMQKVEVESKKLFLK